MAPVQGEVEDRLKALGLELPPPAVVMAGTRLSYRRLVRHGRVAYLSGHLPAWGDEIRHTGRVGAELSVEDGAAAARLACLSMLRTIRDGLGSLDAVGGWLRVTGYVRAVDGFAQQPLVVNGFTDLVRDLWGEERLPARTAIGVADLPLGACVEVDATVALAG